MASAISDNGMVRVEWVDLGEGLCGEYNPDDPNDEPLLRYDAYVRLTGTDMDEIRGLEVDHFLDPGKTPEWGVKDPSSFCTRTNVNTHGPVLELLAKIIAEELADNLDNGGWKSTAERMSWVHPDWIRKSA